MFRLQTIKMQTLSENYKHIGNARPTNITEIKVLLGLIYLGGVRHVNRFSTLDLWKVDGAGIEAIDNEYQRV